MTDAYSAIKEWPKMLYRAAEAGGVEKRIFQSEGDIPKGAGWGDSATAHKNAKPAPAPVTRDTKRLADQEKALAELSNDLHEKTVALGRADAAAHDARKMADAAIARCADLMAFIALVAQSSDAPEEMRKAAEAIVNPPPAEEAEPKRKKIAAKPQE